MPLGGVQRNSRYSSLKKLFTPAIYCKLAGLGGVLLILASVLMACQTHFIPTTPAQWAETGEWFMVICVSTIVCLVSVVAIIHYMGDIPLLRRFALHAMSNFVQNFIRRFRRCAQMVFLNLRKSAPSADSCSFVSFVVKKTFSSSLSLHLCVLCV